MGLLSRSTVAVRPPPLWGGVPEDCIPRDMDGDLHLQPIGSPVSRARAMGILSWSFMVR